MSLMVAFVGSPRKKGNTDNLVDEIAKGAEFKGIEIKKFYLNDMNIKGCQGCLYCRENPTCIIKDDMIEVYKYIKRADYIVLGSPVYICQVSAQSNLLLDRLYPLTEIDKSKHTPRFGEKKLIFDIVVEYFPLLRVEFFKGELSIIRLLSRIISCIRKLGIKSKRKGRKTIKEILTFMKIPLDELEFMVI